MGNAADDYAPDREPERRRHLPADGANHASIQEFAQVSGAPIRCVHRGEIGVLLNAVMLDRIRGHLDSRKFQQGVK